MHAYTVAGHADNLWTLEVGGAFSTAVPPRWSFSVMVPTRIVSTALLSTLLYTKLYPIRCFGRPLVPYLSVQIPSRSASADATSVGVLTCNGAGTLGAGASAPNRLPADLSGVYLAPGTYGATSAISLTGDLYLVLPLNYQAGPEVWEFTIEIGAFTAAARSNMYFVESDRTTIFAASSLASGTSVAWIVDGAITLGSNSHVIGTLHSNSGAISLGADASSGVRTTNGGAITLGVDAYCTDMAGPMCCFCINKYSQDGMDPGCSELTQCIDSDNKEPDFEKPGTQCKKCVNDKPGGATDSGCEDDAPWCDAEDGEGCDAPCVPCIDDGTGATQDSGCDSDNPICIEGDNTPDGYPGTIPMESLESLLSKL
jgi:hypothetical protein